MAAWQQMTQNPTMTEDSRQNLIDEQERRSRSEMNED